MTHKKILLVDDDSDDQFVFKDALTEIASGIECIVANNGLEALDLLEATVPPPSIFFVDLNMPFMNGFEFLEHVKNEKKFREIPVIIFTTSDSPADKRRSLDSGAHLFLTKTSDFKLLKTSLQKILESEW